MADMNIGTARGVITLDYNGRGAAQQAQADIDRVRTTGDRSSESLKKVGNGAAVGALAITAAFGVAVNSAADFEKSLSGIQAVSGATTQEMETVRKKALQLGADTAFSASDASGAIEELVKAGVSIPDVMNGAADATVALAAAGGIQLPEAATIASNAMNQFKLAAKDLPGVADILAGAANASAIDVGDLGQSLAQAGATANLAGLSFKDTAVAIAEMGNAGIKGSDAGTSLKTFLQNLIPTTQAQINLFNKLGLASFDVSKANAALAGTGIGPVRTFGEMQAALKSFYAEQLHVKESSPKVASAVKKFIAESNPMTNQFFKANGELKSLAEIQGVLQKATAGLTKEQKLNYLNTLFGSDAIRAAAVLSESGAKGYNDMAAAMGKMSAADVAKTRMANLSGQIEQLKGSAETMAIQIGSLLIPFLTQAAGTVTNLINAFTSLDPNVQRGIAVAVGFAAGLLAMVAAIIKVVEFVKAARVAMVALNATFLTNPIFLIIAAIVALIAGLVLLYKNNESFRNFVNAAWANIRNAIGAAAGWIMNTAIPWITNAFRSVVTWAQNLWASIVSIWNGIKNAIGTAINAVAATISAVVGAIVGAWNATWSAIGAVVSAVFSFIVTVITTYINIYLTIIRTVLGLILAAWNAFWNGPFGQLVLAAFNLVSAIIQVALAYIVLAIQTAVGFIVAVWQTTWNFILAVVRSVVGFIATVVQTSMSFIASVISNVLNAIRNFFVSVWNAIYGYVAGRVAALAAIIAAVWNAVRGATVAAWNAVYSAVSGPVSRAYGFVVGQFNALRNSLAAVWNSVVSSVRSAWNSVVSAVSSAVNSAVSAVSDFGSRILGYITGVGSSMYSAGRELIQRLIDGITSMVGSAASAMNGLADKIRGFLPGSPIKEGPLRDHGWNSGRPGRQLVDFVASGVVSNLGAVEDAFAGLDVRMPTVPTLAATAIADSASRAAQRGGAPVAATGVVQPVNVDVKVDAPQNMDPDDVGQAVATRVGVALSSATTQPTTLRSK